MIVDFSTYRPKLNRLLRNAIEASPLPLFLLLVHRLNPSAPAEWRMPYFVCTGVAIVTTVWLLVRSETLNRICLGVNLYFLSGSIGLALQWEWLNATYGRLEATGMLLWIVVVGIISTLCSRPGFVAVDAGPTPIIWRNSLYLVGVALCVMFLSWAFVGNALLSAYVPFIILFAAYGLLRGQASTYTP
jgi:hypothetical protein